MSRTYTPPGATAHHTLDAAAPARRGRRISILVVDGFDRRGHWGQYSRQEALSHPWIELCLRQIERHSHGWDYEVLVFDNARLDAHREILRGRERVRVLPDGWVSALGRMADLVPVDSLARRLERRHPQALDHLARHVDPSSEYIVTLDTDSFPVREDWLDVLVGACEDGAALAGVYRDEMAPTIRPFIHVSGLCVRPSDLDSLEVSFARGIAQDVGQNITEELVSADRRIAPLRRSNAVNFHFLIGGLYGDVIYHQGAGSRKAKFWTSTDLDADERVRVVLRDAAFDGIDHLVDVLCGRSPNDLGLEAI